MSDRPWDAAGDRDGLAAYVAEHRPDLAGPFDVERIGSGQSCLTFLVRGEGWEVVLRRPPRGDLPPTAFDVAREFRVTRALAEGQDVVPVPRPLVLCEDRSVIGAPFYLMEKVEGVVVRSEVPPGLADPAEHRRMADELVDTAAALHAVDVASVGLEGFGRPQGYLERQLARIGDQWARARSRPIPEIDLLAGWLAGHAPLQGSAALVHGDYKLDNVMFAPSPPARLVAVVDWEMSTIGDPLADLGWLLFFWKERGEPTIGLSASSVTDMEGFPNRGEVLSRYADRTGALVDDVRWYMALAGWKIAVIMEGSYRRFLAGITDHPGFRELDTVVPELARRALDAAEGRLGP